MSVFQPKEEESSKVDGDEEGFYSRDEDDTSPHLGWPTFEELDDSGHFTASPDGERTFSGSSRSHSPCPSSAQLLLQMQHHNEPHFPQTKPMTSPRSVMTVKVPQQSADSESSGSNYHLTLNSESTLNARLLSHDVIRGSQMTQPPSMTYTPGEFGEGPTGPARVLRGVQEESSEYLRSILDNFNSLYMEKLRLIDDLVTEGDQEQKKLLMEKKTNMLENWAKDVCVQNMVLVHTVEELEREANRKVSALQLKITESTQLAKEHMGVIKKYEQQVKLLLKNHGDTEEKNLVLKIELEKLKSECRRVRDRMNSMLKDNESLITLVCRIRDMGVWDVSGLELQRSSFDQIFGLYPNLVGSEVQTVFTKEKARRAQETEEKVHRLETQLTDLQKSHSEAESYIFQKNRKIEELETEIRNVSNKVQYYEQECNDYKRSLLDTQEKLLEATRRLNASPKTPKADPKVPRLNEVAELIRELRDVKSQLNTAVEEKHSAKEETTYFKKELSERLKEMHDIQNVFQSLATEVVSSRAAFQQVQEKEVQLESLKSEVQAYQTRCVNAEDTIRRKEEEIKELQKEMNRIHTKSQRSRLSSSSNSVDERALISKGGPGMLNFYNLRNVSSPSRIPVRQPVKPVIKPLGNKGNYRATSVKLLSESSRKSSGHRPPWNTNFKKKEKLISSPASELPLVSMSSLSKESESSIRRRHSVNPANLRGSIVVPTKRQERRHQEQHLPSDQVSFKTDQTVNSALQKTKELEKKVDKLPALQRRTLSPKKDCPSPRRPQSGLKLPIVPPPVNKTPPKKVDNPILKNLIHNPLGHTPRLNELITAVVETSKQLLGEGGISSQGGQRDLKITAVHYRKHRKDKSSARRVQSSDMNAEVNRSVQETMSSPKVQRHSSATGVSNLGQDDIEVTNGVLYRSPRDVKAFLSGLPQQSQEDIVKGWIAKSQSNQSVKVVKAPPVSGRRPSIKVMKHLATRRCPNVSPKVQNKPSNESIQALEAEMFELEEEWGKVFSNIESPPVQPPGESYEEKVDKRVGLVPETQLEPQEEVILEPEMESLGAESTRTVPEESMQELLERLTAGKHQMEEHFRKQLYDKDVEIRMQKVTIQHLQDAYVALKRGQPIPIPQNVTGNGILANGASSSNGHHHIGGSSQVLDV